MSLNINTSAASIKHIRALFHSTSWWNSIITNSTIIHRLFWEWIQTLAFIASPLRKKDKPSNPLSSPASIPIRVSRCAFSISVPSTAHCNMTFHGRLCPESEEKTLLDAFWDGAKSRDAFAGETTVRKDTASLQLWPHGSISGTFSSMLSWGEPGMRRKWHLLWEL